MANRVKFYDSWGRIAWETAELAICTIAIKRGTGEERDAAVVVLNNIVTLNSSDRSHPSSTLV
jgi:hypothetical protein